MIDRDPRTALEDFRALVTKWLRPFVRDGGDAFDYARLRRALSNADAWLESYPWWGWLAALALRSLDGAVAARRGRDVLERAHADVEIVRADAARFSAIVTGAIA